MKKIIITKNQLFKLNEENSVNVDVPAKNNTTADFTNAATNPNTVSDLNKASMVGDANLMIHGPQNNDSQPTQNVNVAAGDTIQNAIKTQANDELIRNGGSIKVSGDGIGESKVFSKKYIEEARLNQMKKTGVVMTKKQMSESLNLI